MLYSVLILFLFTTYGYSASADAVTDTVKAELQTAVRVHADRPRPEDKEAAFITVLDEKDFKRRHVSLTDVLSETPGLVVKRLGGYGAYSTMSIRGSTAENVQVYLDGVLLNSAMGGGVDFGTIPLENIEKVEIYRGTLPVGSGGSGMGGVIRISTKSTRRGHDFTAAVAAGTFGYGSGMAMLRFPVKKMRALVLCNLESAENDYPFTFNGTEKIRSNAGYRIINPLVKLSGRIGAVRLHVNNSTLMTRKGLPAMADSPRQTEMAGLNGWTNMLRAECGLSLRPDGGLKLHSDAFWTVAHEHYLDTLTIHDPDRPRESEFSTQYDFDTQTSTRSLGGSIELRQSIGAVGMLSYKASYANDTYSYEDELGPEQDNHMDNTRHTGGITCAGTFYLLHDRLSVNSTWHQGIVGAEYHGLRKYDPTPPETLFTSTYPSLYSGIKAKLNSYTLLKANAGLGYRIPSNFELFGNTGTHLGNTELKPERSISADIGIRVQTPAKRFRCEISAFGVLYRNMIQAYVYSQDLVKHINYGETGNTGLEISWHVNSFIQNLTIDGNVTLQRPTNLTVKYADRSDPDGPYYGTVLPNQAQIHAFSKLNYNVNSYSAFTEYLHLSSSFRDQLNINGLRARHVWNCGIACTSSRIVVSGIVKNVFNASFMDLIGYPQPGRQFIVKAEYRITENDDLASKKSAVE